MANYWTFEGATVEELTRQLTAHPGARLRVIPHDGDGLMLFVVPHGATAPVTPDGGLNESHPCPPFCG